MRRSKEYKYRYTGTVHTGEKINHKIISLNINRRSSGGEINQICLILSSTLEDSMNAG